MRSDLAFAKEEPSPDWSTPHARLISGVCLSRSGRWLFSGGEVDLNMFLSNSWRVSVKNMIIIEGYFNKYVKMIILMKLNEFNNVFQTSYSHVTRIIQSP